MRTIWTNPDLNEDIEASITMYFDPSCIIDSNKEMKAYQADIAKFESNDTQVFGMSVDSVPANREFAKQIGGSFPLLSDFKRTVVKDYGVFNEEQGFGNRATFLIRKKYWWLDQWVAVRLQYQ